MKSIGHVILPQGRATGHSSGAEFHRLQEKKKRKNAVGESKCNRSAANVQQEKH